MVRRARPIVRAASGIVITKRFIFNGETIPDVSSVDFDNPLKINLAVCTETEDEELTADGTNVPTVPLYSRFLGMKGRITVIGPSASAVVHRWKIYKKPDGEDLLSDAGMMVDAGFHASTDSPTFREVRKFDMAKGMLFTNASTGITPVNYFIKRSAMKRVGPMRENDRITFAIAKDATGAASLLHGFGTLYFRANA